jgi:hypothetical protein
MADPQTSPPAKVEGVSPDDAKATLKLYVDLINSERAAIWARNAAMLVGNSFIINAIKSEPARSESGLNLLFSLAGIAICVLWFIMTWVGWAYSNKLMRKAEKLPVGDPQLNPFKWVGPTTYRDWILWCTMALIVLFALMYVASIGHFCGIKLDSVSVMVRLRAVSECVRLFVSPSLKLL